MQNCEVHFKPAVWISSNGIYPTPMFRKIFFTTDVKHAEILIGCFGMFEGFLNQTPISQDLFGTLNTPNDAFFITNKPLISNILR